MVELGFRFIQGSNVFYFLALVCVFALWAWSRQKENKPLSLWPVISCNLVLLVLWAFALRWIDHDEAEHLHAAWLVGQGLVPYRDFWQHHAPLLWVAVAPLIKLVKPAADIFIYSRIIFAFIFTVNLLLGWQICRRIWKEQASLPVYLALMSSCAIPGEYLFIRPDALMIFFLLCVTALSLEIPRGRALVAFSAGVSAAMAFSFISKQYLLIFLPLVAITASPVNRRTAQAAGFACGIVVGCLPLGLYLYANGIIKEFFFWVFQFNSQLLIFAGFFPLVLLCAAGWQALVLARRLRSGGAGASQYLVLWALGLSTASSLACAVVVNRGYYLGFWFILCAAIAAGPSLVKLLEKIRAPQLRVAVFAAICALLISPSLVNLREKNRDTFVNDLAAVRKLIALSSKGSVLVLLPMHPVFAHDATRLYSAWQYLFASSLIDVRADIRREPFAQQIIQSPPAVVAARFERKDVLLEMYQRKLITAAEYKELVRFLQDQYQLTAIGHNSYYIRTEE